MYLIPILLVMLLKLTWTMCLKCIGSLVQSTMTRTPSLVLARIHVFARGSSAAFTQSSSSDQWPNGGGKYVLELYLRCMCADVPHLWSRWLPLAEWWYNTSYHIKNQLQSIFLTSRGSLKWNW